MGLAQSLSGLWILEHPMFCFTYPLTHPHPHPPPPESLAVMGFDSKHDFATPIIFWGFSFAFGCGVSFLVGSNILLLIVVQP